MGVVNSMKAQLSFKRCKRKRKKNQKKILLMFYAHWLILGTSRYMMESQWKNALRTLWDKDGLVYFDNETENQIEGANKKKKNSLSGSVQDTKHKKIEVRQSINKASWDWSRLALLDQLEAGWVLCGQEGLRTHGRARQSFVLNQS